MLRDDEEASLSRQAATSGEDRSPPDLADLGANNTSPSTYSHSVVCKQCRARKVKCDRGEPCCGPCKRLRLDCSLGLDELGIIVQQTFPAALTQAGTKRKRARQACHACRKVKVKCSGAYPCRRCHNRKLCCDLDNSIDDLENATEDHRASANISENASRDPDVYSAELIAPQPQCSVVSPLDKSEVKGFIISYFDSANRTGISMLHKPTILAEWSKGALDLTLLKLIVAHGLYNSDKSINDSGATETARNWIQDVQDGTLKHLGRHTVGHLRILVMLLRFRYETGDFGDAWNLLALAARLVFTLGLNHERTGIDPASQESIRRMVWMIYAYDRQCSGGIDYLTLCPVDKMYIRLPSDEQSFEMGIPSTAGYLENSGVELNVFSYKLRMLAIRDRILRCTKRIRRMVSDLSGSQCELEALQKELDQFAHNLPTEMKLSPQRSNIMAYSTNAANYVDLHTMWLQSHCDLYRHCVSGIREAANPEALAMTTPYFVESCQRACLGAAVRLCDFWSQLYYLQSTEYLGSGFMAVSIYQVAQILHHSPPPLISEAANNHESAHGKGKSHIAVLQRKLVEAIDVATPKSARCCNFAKCLQDTERLVAALSGHTRYTLPANGNRPPPSPTASTVSDEAAQEDHQQSRHHMLGYIGREHGLAASAQTSGLTKGSRCGLSPEEEALRQSSIVLGGMDNQTSPSGQYIGAMVQRTSDDVQGIPTLTGNPFAELPPWDPFDMELNDYYDGEFGALYMGMQ